MNEKVKMSFKELLEALETDDIIGIWTEIHFRKISDQINNQERKRYVFISAKGTLQLVELLKLDLSELGENYE